MLIALRRRTARALLALPLLPGCAGGQTGEEEQLACPVRVTRLANDQSSSLGFSPRDMSRRAEGEHRAAIEWLPAPATPYGPESGESELRIVVAVRDSARLVVNEDAMRPCCDDNVQVDVHVTFATSGGAFDESFDTLLFAQSAERTALFQQLGPERLEGTFAFDSLREDQRLALFQLSASFDDEAFSGSLLAAIEHASGGGLDGSVSLGPVPLAGWGTPLPTGRWCTTAPP